MVAATANAASLQKVNQSDWWAGTSGLPSYVNMYAYVPDGLATNPPIVVAPHHCQGTAQSTYSEMASLLSIADKTGFLVIFPEATGENCWDAGSMRSLTHGGGGDTGAVVQMVKYALSKYGANAARVYSVGGSSGGIMTEALLGVYPDVFMAGVSLMGVPCGCWAQGYSDVTGTGSTAQWSGSCASGDVSKTGQAWGDLVRSYYPGYTGHRPRLQHWHGTADTTLNFKNLAEDVKEWTNLLGLSETPTGSDTPKSGTAHQFWKNSCGYTVYETFSLSGVAHAVPFDGNAVAAYFGLDSAGATDPEATACGGGGMGGTGAGPGGMGGRSASDAGGAGP
ncbi:MAG TPA: PHB depolymerase family esterase, partial [Polyangiaceae bacterium]|nr:PHB depolymerase family esterase [Polyangiaceae bacterium]